MPNLRFWRLAIVGILRCCDILCEWSLESETWSVAIDVGGWEWEWEWGGKEDDRSVLEVMERRMRWTEPKGERVKGESEIEKRTTLSTSHSTSLIHQTTNTPEKG
jgi:hypothetical protein